MKSAESTVAVRRALEYLSKRHYESAKLMFDYAVEMQRLYDQHTHLPEQSAQPITANIEGIGETPLMPYNNTPGVEEGWYVQAHDTYIDAFPGDDRVTVWRGLNRFTARVLDVKE